VDVTQKIDSAITECMRLGTHAIRTAMVPLPFSGMIGTPTVSRIICEHVLQCFGFPKAAPEEIEEIMSRVVMGNLKNFMKVSMSQFAAVSVAAVGSAVPTAGIGIIVGIIGCVLASPPTARMLFKCSCDMILILERSFRYQGKYVSVKEIEDAAIYYTTATTKTFSGKEVLLQQHVHDEVDRLIPLKKISVGFHFAKLRSGLQDIIYMNRFDKTMAGPLSSIAPVELDANTTHELDTKMAIVELDSREMVSELTGDNRSLVELESPATTLMNSPSTSSDAKTTNFSLVESRSNPSLADETSKEGRVVELDDTLKVKRTTSEASQSLFKRSLSKWSLRKPKTSG
jgi:hypothetical protein